MESGDDKKIPVLRIWVVALTSAAGALGAAVLDVIGRPEVLMLGNWFRNLPPPMLAVALGVAVTGSFLVGAFMSLAAVRRARGAYQDLRAAERQVVRAKEELANIQRSIADRTLEYVEIGDRIHEAAIMLAWTEEQTASLVRAFAEATSRAQRAWWVSLAIFVLGITIGYATEWTADLFKPPFIPEANPN
ncbi:hypothetical protein [Herbidospora sp. RD11066]